MKIKSTILFLLVTSLSLYGSVYRDSEGRNWYYRTEVNGGVTLTIVPPVTNLVIPAYIEGHPVVGISANLSWNGGRLPIQSVQRLQLPFTVTNITTSTSFGRYLSEIVVDPLNPRYEAIDNVLYDKDIGPDLYGKVYSGEKRLLWCGSDKTNLMITAQVTSFGLGMDRGRYNGIGGASYSTPYKCEWGGDNLQVIEVEANNPVFCSYDGMLCMKSYVGSWRKYDSLCRCPPAFVGDKTIHADIEKLSMFAFYDCRGIENILVDSANTTFSSVNGMLCTKDGARALAIPGGRSELVIPSSVKCVANTFPSAALRCLTLEDGIEIIGARAFYNCPKLESVIIPESVTNIGEYAFSDCVMTGSVVMNGDALREIPKCCFSGCSTLTSIVFSSGIETIAEGSFRTCSMLMDVDFPNSLKSIGRRAFSSTGIQTLQLHGNNLSVEASAFSASKIENLIIDSSVKSIASSAFLECTSLSAINVSKDSVYYSVTNGCLCNKSMDKLCLAPYTLTEFTMPNCVLTIGSYAFSGHDSLTNIVMSQSLDRIEDNAFSDCELLNSLSLPTNATFIGNYAFSNCTSLNEFVSSSVNHIGDYAFSGCVSLQYFDMPHSIVYLGDYVFSECHDLAAINLSTNLEFIGYSAFSDCDALESIIIPSKVATLNSETFYNCSNLCAVILMKGLTTIDDDVWQNCTSLTNLLIPSSVQELGRAFGGCSNIVSISFAGNAPSISDYSFRRLSTTNINDIADEHSISSTSTTYYEDGSSVTWYYYYVKISGYLFNGTREDLCVYVKPGSSGWIDEDVTGIPEEWPVESSNGRNISYDETITDPDWLEEYRYKVQIKFNRYSSGDKWLMPITHYWYIGDEIEIPDAMGQEKSGFSFRGWSDGVDAYRTGEKYTLTSGGVTFVPIWGSPTFVLRYDSNGGAGTMTNEEYVVGAEVVLQTNAFTMAKREFLGWGEESDGPVKCVDGQRTIEIRPLLEDEVVLYAIWSEAKLEIGDYLDCSDLDFTTVEPSPWTGVSDVTHSTIGAMRSGCVTNGESVLGVCVSGEGKIEFWWKVSSETYKTFQIDYASFRVDGVEQSWIGGEIDWQHIVFDVAGDGQHTISWAYVKDKDGSDGNDCAWLDEVSWTPNAIPVDPIPDLGDTPTQAEIKAALNGSADTNLIEHITNGVEYAAYRTWAMNVKKSDGSTTAGLQAVHDSENAWLSYALQTDELISATPTNGSLKISTMGHSLDAGWFDLTVSVDGVSVGTTASTENLKQVFGIEGASILDADAFSVANVDVIFDAPVDGKVKCTVAPRDEKTSSFFMKIRMVR